MTVHLWSRRGEAEAAQPGDTVTAPRRPWQRGAHARTAPVPVGDAPSPVVERPRRRWRRHGSNPVSMAISAAGWAAALILLLGMLLVWSDANPGNVLVERTLDAGRWLATPFHDLFTRRDPDEQLYINWGIAAVAYYAVSRIVAWLVRF
ncbi:hypothetical protein BTM25_18510 [Actinomadura rubteroloni]|uniref:Uncharacterized protein n=1 Tax=Actinomadura rubteroloni TaxID=1926885 RepID=A0A2P4UQW7_9ACTN|nr:hypothetical protein [Actinomadura rubteroloni]POM27437.1 hypothetical protein BTM25_18510 [Actinomadura rubteroloni]